jgi:hypothetical protein
MWISSSLGQQAKKPIVDNLGVLECCWSALYFLRCARVNWQCKTMRSSLVQLQSITASGTGRHWLLLLYPQNSRFAELRRPQRSLCTASAPAASDYWSVASQSCYRQYSIVTHNKVTCKLLPVLIPRMMYRSFLFLTEPPKRMPCFAFEFACSCFLRVCYFLTTIYKYWSLPGRHSINCLGLASRAYMDCTWPCSETTDAWFIQAFR